MKSNKKIGTKSLSHIASRQTHAINQFRLSRPWIKYLIKHWLTWQFIKHRTNFVARLLFVRSWVYRSLQPWHNIILCKFVRALHKPYASEWSQYKLTVMSPLDSLCIKCFTKTRFEIYIYVNYGNYTRETQECRLNTIHSSYVVTCKVTLIPRIISIFLAPEFEFKCGLRKS